MTNTFPNNRFNFTLESDLLQIKMNFDYDLYVEDDGKISLVRKLVERLDLDILLSAYRHYGRKPAVDPATMLQILIFCYSEGLYSCRQIEKACKYDLRVRSLLGGQIPPDYSTINRFRQKIMPFSESILDQFVKLLLEDGHIDLTSIYIDGTKIESMANRYTFVWKKVVLRNQENLRNKVCNELDLDESLEVAFVRDELKKKLYALWEEVKREGVAFVYGKGKRKTPLQREIETAEKWMNRFVNYEKDLKIMGERNSYSKTDPDATFMRMKDDHMRNGQLKPAYNIQFASSGQFVVGAFGSHHPSDMPTLRLFLDQLLPKYDGEFCRIVCDSGYESIENYTYIEKQKLKAFIKPSNYETSKTKKRQQNPGLRENMTYVAEDDYYICQNGKKLLRQKDGFSTRKSGFKEKLRRYRCFECEGCPLVKQCQRCAKTENPKTKGISFSPEFQRLREQSRKNILSNEGINERLNRSIQAEGAFSRLKDGLSYQRFRHRGLKNILSEMHLMAVAMNINTLQGKLKRKEFKFIRYEKVA